MDEDNLLKRGGKMSAGERRFLINNVIAEVTERVMKNDNMIINLK